MARAGAYAEPQIYDFLHTPGTAGELNALERIAERFVDGPCDRLRWLEPGCGAGRFLRLLGRRGARAVGVDIEAASVEFANERLKRLGLNRLAVAVCADMRTLDRSLGTRARFDFAFCPHNSVRHLLTERDLARHITAVRRVLSPGGVYAVGVGLQDPDEPIDGEDLHSASRRGLKVTELCQYFDALTRRGQERRERVVLHVTMERREGVRMVESWYDLLCVDPEMWRRCVAGAGMTEVAIVDDQRARDLPGDRLGYAYRVLKLA